jgi:hypothetical protein
MSLRVVITKQAEREMQAAFNWSAGHRSKRQADRWYSGFAKAIVDLSGTLSGMANPEKGIALPMRFATFFLG